MILVREETNPEDVEGMRAAVGILTGRGGMTSHAALVARGWGKCCIVGAGALDIDVVGKKISVDGRTFVEGDVLTLNGTRGLVYAGELAMIDATENPRFQEFMKLADAIRALKVRTNADTPDDARQAIEFGAEGIGLFRTEHMFYGKGSEQPLFLLRKMIMSGGEAERRAALDELFPFVKHDMKATLEVMDGLPVTIRLLDPPLHEFVPNDREGRKKLAEALSISADELDRRADELHEINPMMGHRGVRLGVTFPEITEMQFRAILEAAAELRSEGKACFPEIMVPVTCAKSELDDQLELARKVHAEVCQKYGVESVEHLYGTMIEIPRAALTADEMAEDRRVLLLRHQRPDPDDLRLLARRHRRLPARLPRPQDPRRRPVPGARPRLGRGAGQDRHRARPLDPAGPQGRHLRRARRRAQLGGVLPLVGMNYVSCSPYRVPIARWPRPRRRSATRAS